MTSPTVSAVLSAMRHQGEDLWAAGLAAAAPAETADDRRLYEQIEHVLLATGHQVLSALSVSVRDRWVTLCGRVPRYYLRQLALAAVLTTPGVLGLHDEVAVTPPA
jgi:osmotically-inducible protein OsmY